MRAVDFPRGSEDQRRDQQQLCGDCIQSGAHEFLLGRVILVYRSEVDAGFPGRLQAVFCSRGESQAGGRRVARVTRVRYCSQSAFPGSRPMHLRKRGWLDELVGQVDDSQRAEQLRLSPLVQGLPSGTNRMRARAYLRRSLRQSGLLFGTPAEGFGLQLVESRRSETALFHAVIRTFLRIGLDLADLLQAPTEPRREQLLQLLEAISGTADSPSPAERLPRLEAALERRATLSGDPVYRLVLHNGSTYVDARLFGRLAIDLFSRGILLPAATAR